MKMTIYLPDDLAEQVKTYDELNVSAVCQDALRNEITHRQTLADLDKGMEDVEVWLTNPGVDAVFTGKLLATDDRHDVAAYLTERHRIAIYDGGREELEQFDTFDELAKDEGWDDTNPEFIAAIAAALGKQHRIRLNI